MRAWFRESFLAFAVGLSVAAGPLSTRAESESPAAAAISRQVGPHCFAGAASFPNPFLSSYVRTSTGLASTTNYGITIYDLGDPPRVVKMEDVSLQYLLLEFEFQERVGRAVAIRATASGAGRMGIIDTSALLSDGVKVDIDCMVGGTVALCERARFKLSGSLDVIGSYLGDVLIRNFVDDVVANGLSDSTNSVWEDATSLRATTGLRAAFGQSETVGYLLYGDVGVKTPYFEGEDTEFVWNVGGAVSLDLHERLRPDIGLTINAAYSSPGRQDQYIETSSWHGGLGVFYTTRPELTLGVETGYISLRKAMVDGWFGMISMRILLRYDFS